MNLGAIYGDAKRYREAVDAHKNAVWFLAEDEDAFIVSLAFGWLEHSIREHERARNQYSVQEQQLMEREQRLAQREASCQQQEAQLNIYAQENVKLKAEIQARAENLRKEEQQFLEREQCLAQREAECQQIEARVTKTEAFHRNIVDALKAAIDDDDIFTRRAAIQIIEGLGDEGRAILEKARAKRQREDDLRRTRS
jgi:Fe-S cluster assembly scaffold protein SufB